MTTYRIRALVWEQDGDIHSAASLSGCYFVFGPYHGGKFKAKCAHNGIGEFLAGHHDSLDAAKQACTERWESLIRQALDEVVGD